MTQSKTLTPVTRLPATGWTEIRAHRGLLRRLDLRELWAYREIGLVLALTALRVRYKQTALGILWVLAPLSTVVLFTLVFGELAGLPSDGLPYPVFVYAGLIIWQYVSGSISAATGSLVGARDLVTKIYFPRMLAPMAALVPRLTDMAISLCAMAIIMAAYDVAPGWPVLLVPVWILLAIALSLAVGLITSAVNVRFRDVGYALPLALQLWMFASPVIFASSAIEGKLRVLLALNPMTGLLDGFRWSVAGASAPPAVDLLSLLVGASTLLVAVLFFQRVERGFADVI